MDARKRTKVERPEAQPDDVRLMQRHGRRAQAMSAGASMPPQPGAMGMNSPMNPPSPHAPRASRAGSMEHIPLGMPAAGGTAAAAALQYAPAAAAAYGTAAGGAVTSCGLLSSRMLDAMGDAMVEVRGDGVVVQMLSSRVFGYGPAELLGRSILTVFHPTEHAPMLQTLRGILALAANVRGAASTAVPQSVRALHKVIVGLGKPQVQPQAVLMDTIISIVLRDGDDSPPATLLLCSRPALPAESIQPASGVAAGASNPAAGLPSFRVFVG